MTSPPDLAARVEYAVEQALVLNSLSEFSWIDFKEKWSDLSGNQNWCEFLKDVCGMVNFGTECIIVFGVRQPGGQGPVEVVDAPFDGSGYKSSADLQRRIAAATFPPVRVEIGAQSYKGHHLTYVSIPQTHNRPHLALTYTSKSGLVYNNALFWREGSTTYGPSDQKRRFPERNILDEMYLDRPEHQTEVRVGTWKEMRSRWGGLPGGGGPDGHFLMIPVTLAARDKVSIQEIRCDLVIERKGLSPPVKSSFPNLEVARYRVPPGGDKFEFALPLEAGGAKNVELYVPLSIPDWIWLAQGETEQSPRAVEARLTLLGFFGGRWQGEVRAEVKSH